MGTRRQDFKNGQRAGRKHEKIGPLLAVSALAVSASHNNCLYGQEITRLTKTLTEIKDKNGGKVESSAVVPIDDKSILIAHDKRPQLLAFDTEGTALAATSKFDFPIVCEAMAKDTAGNFYVISSRGTLIRFRFGVGFSVVAPLTTTVKVSNGEIEGLAIQESDSRRFLVVGFRDESSDVIRVHRADITNLKEGQVLTPDKYFRFDARKTQAISWHLSSIEYVKEWKGFIVITATEIQGTDTFYGNRLWFVSETEINKQSVDVTDGFRHVSDLSKSCVFETEMKAEGLAVKSSNSNGAITVYIVYDNDSRGTGKLEVAELTNVKRP